MPADPAPPPDQPRLLRFQTSDVDEFRSIVSTHHVPGQVQPLNPASFKVGAASVTTGGICFSQTVCPTGVDLVFDGVFDGYGLSLPPAGSFAVRVAGQGMLESNPGFGLMLDSSRVTRAVFGPDTNMPRISISSHDMHSRLADLIDQPILRRIRFAPNVRLDSPAASMARTLSRLVHEGVEGDAPLLKYPAAFTSLREAIVHLMLEALPHSYADHLRRQVQMPAPAHVKRAIDFMLVHAAAPLRLSDIAMAAGTSVRSLQGGFMRFRGMPPMAYLRNIRLNGVRAALLAGAPGTTVSHVAHTWGFAHLSSFSTLYLRAFGERPSTTLRLATGSVPPLEA